MNKLHSYLFAIFMITISGSSFGQQPIKRDSSNTLKLCADLKISVNVATEMIKAMHTHEYEIDTLIKSRKVTQEFKQQKFLELYHDREQKVLSLLTPDQQESFKRLILNYLALKRQRVRDSLSVIKQREFENQLKKSN